ncbi:MAG: hypothetical protein JJU34_04610 [Lunatimonas sp.]|uniref:hypothetical protein n=1 Tax=Lunatimonas sp. TaxID=2060141 RepID=UPI00263AD72D|nr:hypothetical protein [Lunatimonas sp.]MCC5936540.1 hypothetical protein [Lunatimonas sp.]
MEILVSLLIFTFSYSLAFLSLFPLKAFKRVPPLPRQVKRYVYQDYDLTWPYFISFLAGYLLAFGMVYLIWDSI